MTRSVRRAPALAVLALALPAVNAFAEEAPVAESAPATAPASAPAPTQAPAIDADLARDMQTPSPGGPGTPRALIVDRPEFQVALRGFGQFSLVPFVGADASVEAGDAARFAGMRVRRAQLGIEGKAGRGLSFGLWLDLAGEPLLTQARLAYTFRPEIAIETGVVRIPFSKSAIQSSAELSFAERPLSVSHVVPDQQPGVAVYGAVLGGRASYRAGVFNGAEVGKAGQGNDHPGLLWAGRVAVSPLGPLRPGQADVERGPIRFEVGANAFRNDAAGLTQSAMSFDLSAQGYGFSLLAEYLQDTRTPIGQVVVGPTLPDRIERSGLIGQISYMIWKDGLEVALRSESADDNAALQDAGDVNATVVGLHWYPAGHDLRVNLDWYHRGEKVATETRDNDSLVLGTQGRF